MGGCMHLYLFTSTAWKFICTVWSTEQTNKSYEGKYVHRVLVNGLVKLAQEKVWLDELTLT